MIQAKAAVIAKQFKNKGWLHYDAMKQLLLSKTCGSLAFYTRMPPAPVGALPSQATTSQPTNFNEADAFEQEILLENIESGTNTTGTMLPPPPLSVSLSLIHYNGPTSLPLRQVLLVLLPVVNGKQVVTQMTL